jgi:hypothetical protein
MLKRSMVLALGFAALAAPWYSTPGVAALATNALAPNALTANALVPNALVPNGLNSTNALVPNGPATNFTTLQAVRLALPDGSKVTLR